MNPPPVPPDDSPPKPMLQGMDLGGLFSIGMSDEAAALDPTTWRLPSIESIADSIMGYRITQLLGRGGMGAVYAAQQLSLERVVAIKILPREASHDEAFVQRFHREARTLGKLQHPGIVAVYDFGTTPDGYLFIVMEYVEGTTLHDLIHGGHLQVTEALEIVKQICDALAYAHEEGIIHRDIKPTNILLDKKGRVKVADFGLAKMAAGSDSSTPSVTPPPSIARTRTGVGLGTPDYAAPEQMRGHSDVDHRADIYSLGVMFYEMLTGNVPRGYFDPPSKRRGTDARLDSVVLRAMHEQPAQRYQQASAMRDDVTRVQSSVGLDPQPWQRPGDSGSRGNLAWIIALLVCFAVGAWWWVQNRPTAAVATPIKAPAVNIPVASPKPLLIIPEVSKPQVPKAKAGSDAKPSVVATTSAPIRAASNAPAAPVARAPVEPATTTSVAPMPQVLLPQANASASTFLHHRYALIAEAMPWAKAQAYAKAKGGRLATASSREISAWLAAHLLNKQPGLVFIGGQCWMPGGAWEWDSGTEWSHAEWSAATPFYGALAIDADGKWQALSFDEARPFIIEWPSD